METQYVSCGSSIWTHHRYTEQKVVGLQDASLCLNKAWWGGFTGRRNLFQREECNPQAWKPFLRVSPLLFPVQEDHEASAKAGGSPKDIREEGAAGQAPGRCTEPKESTSIEMGLQELSSVRQKHFHRMTGSVFHSSVFRLCYKRALASQQDLCTHTCM